MQVYALDILFQTPMPFYVFRALLTVTNVDFVYDIFIPFAINIIIVSKKGQKPVAAFVHAFLKVRCIYFLY